MEKDGGAKPHQSFDSLAYVFMTDHAKEKYSKDVFVTLNYLQLD